MSLRRRSQETLSPFDSADDGAGDQICEQTESDSDAIGGYVPNVASAAGNELLSPFIEDCVSERDRSGEDHNFAEAKAAGRDSPAEQKREAEKRATVIHFVGCIEAGHRGFGNVSSEEDQRPVGDENDGS